MRLQTRICDLFGITHPILNAPMGGGDAPGALAAAVTTAGGLGMIGGTTEGDTRWLVEQIRTARELTDGPLGVGLLSQRPNAWRLMNAALDEGIRVIAHSFADPAPFVPQAHDAGAIVICQVRTVEDARRAADAGVDVITAQGTEAGGHTGHMSTATLVPAVVDAVAQLPVVAAGGIADGRSFAAMLMLGAEGAWIGTRFLATHECGVDDLHTRRHQRERRRHDPHRGFRHRGRHGLAAGRRRSRDPGRILRPVARQRGRAAQPGPGGSSRPLTAGRRSAARSRHVGWRRGVGGHESRARRRRRDPARRRRHHDPCSMPGAVPPVLATAPLRRCVSAG
jgi:hypothetical protein